MGLLRRLFSCAATLLPVSSFAATLTALVGARHIQIPVPNGMQEVANRNSDLRRLAESKIPAELRLLACFLPDTEVAALHAVRPISWNRHVMVVAYKADEGKDKNEAQFARFLKYTDESLARRRGTAEEATVIERGANYYSYVGLREHAANAATREPARTIVTAPVFVLVKSTQFAFFVYANYSGSADLRWARRTAVFLRRAALRLNESIDIAAGRI